MASGKVFLCSASCHSVQRAYWVSLKTGYPSKRHRHFFQITCPESLPDCDVCDENPGFFSKKCSFFSFKRKPDLFTKVLLLSTKMS